MFHSTVVMRVLKYLQMVFFSMVQLIFFEIGKMNRDEAVEFNTLANNLITAMSKQSNSVSQNIGDSSKQQEVTEESKTQQEEEHKVEELNFEQNEKDFGTN